MHYPITHDGITPDKRYSVSLEYCGHEKQKLVLRFCGEFIGSFNDLPSATLRAAGHKAILNGAEIITEMKG